MPTRAVRDSPTANSQAKPQPTGAVVQVISRRVSIISAVCLGGLVAFLLGASFAMHKPWPYKPMEKTWKLLGDAWRYRQIAPENAINPAPAHRSSQRWLAHHPEALFPGYRALIGFVPDAGEFGVWIHDAEGQLVHQRLLQYGRLEATGSSRGLESPHAFLFLPDGSVIVNTDNGDAIARHDLCGKPLWSRQGAFHHSLALDNESGVWTWQGETSTFDQYHSLVRFDPENGNILESIDLFDDIINATAESRAIFSLSPGQELEHFRGPKAIADLFHPNDLKVLQPRMADAFEQFDTGDFLLSFRNLDLVMVVDRRTLAIKWWSHGPWRRQHDPEFRVDGRLSVFNNNPARPGSTIVTIDPLSRKLDVLDVESDYRFFTRYMGKHQYLANGHVQVVVPYEGRVLEFDAAGELVLEINNLFDEDSHAFVSDAAWLSPAFFDRAPASFECLPE